MSSLSSYVQLQTQDDPLLFSKEPVTFNLQTDGLSNVRVIMVKCLSQEHNMYCDAVSGLELWTLWLPVRALHAPLFILSTEVICSKMFLWLVENNQSYDMYRANNNKILCYFSCVTFVLPRITTLVRVANKLHHLPASGSIQRFRVFDNSAMASSQHYQSVRVGARTDRYPYCGYRQNWDPGYCFKWNHEYHCKWDCGYYPQWDNHDLHWNHECWNLGYHPKWNYICLQ